MRTFWLTAHLVGMALWIGGGVATMVAGIVSKRLAPGPRLGAYRITSAVWRILVGPGALVVVVSGVILAMPYMKSGVVPGSLGLMMMAGIVGALVALTVALPTAAALGRLEIDAQGGLPPRFGALRMRLVWAASIAGGLALTALIAAAVSRG
jgi:hypothetical protein